MGQHSSPAGQGGDGASVVDVGRELGWQLLEATPDAIVAVSPDGLVVFANHQAEEMFGCGPSGLVGCTVESLVPDGARSVHAEHRDSYFADPRARAMAAGQLLWGRRCDDGSEFLCEISMSSVTTAAGPLALTAIRNITGRITAEHRYAQMLELAPDATLVVDSNGVIVTANQQAERVFGYPRGDMVGQPIELLVPQRLRAGHVAQRAAYAADPRPRAMGAGLTLYARRADGAEFPCEISLATIQDDDKAVVLAAVRDVSDRVEEGRKAQQLEHGRALLANMLGIEERARAGIASELHDDTVQVMTAALMSLDRLALIAKRSGADDLARAVLDTRHTISEAVERTRRLMFELRPALLHERGLCAAVGTMVHRAGEEMDAFAVSDVVEGRYNWSVEELVYRALQELVTNARKHSRAKRLKVTVAVTVATTGQHERLACSVHDDGRGFDMERAAVPGVTAFHVGLETMLERVRAAGGEADVKSAPTHGTQVDFWVPAQPVEPVADQTPAPVAA